MQHEDVILFSSLGAIGVVSGCLAATLSRRSPEPFLWTALVAVGSASLLGLLVGMALMATHCLQTGTSFRYAVGAALGSCITLGVVVPVLSGVPALMVGLGLQWRLQRRQKHGHSPTRTSLPRGHQ